LRRRAPSVVIVTLLLALTGCSPFVKPTLPGETRYAIDEVVFAEGLSLDPTPLKVLLSVRADAPLIAGQPYNPYRLAEDRRRIAAYWQNFGFFDVVVDKAEVSFHAETSKATVFWRVDEGERFSLNSVKIEGAPEAFARVLGQRVPFAEGDLIDVASFRVVRHDLADILRAAGHLRAEVYSRTYVDRTAKDVRWVFYVDAGPKSVVGRVTVKGNRSISEESLRARVGLSPGDPIDLPTLRKRELDLMDLGAFATARIKADVGTEFETGAVPWESWIPPDTGGILKIEQIDDEGRLVPRKLAAEVDLEIEVVESPSTQGQFRVGTNIDLERVDPFVGTRLTLRNALGELHHLVLEGHVGYGQRWRGEVDEPLGLYGSGKIQWSRPHALGRTGDLRLSATFDEVLHRGFHWRTGALGLGLRVLLDTGLYVDLEPRLRYDLGVGLGAFDPLALTSADIAAPATTLAQETRMALVWDKRNDGVEALSGHLVSLDLALAPLGDRTWWSAGLDLRYFLPFSSDLGLAFRAASSWVKSLDGDGTPIGVRLFGGGAWGMRGFGAKRLSLYRETCRSESDCQTIPVGASSLFEGSMELRWLPFRKQVGAVAFIDVGGVGHGMNPFEDAVELAVGAGLRVRLWHFPVGLDLSWRPTDDAIFQGSDLDSFLVFLRLGEAF
jgi:outer membrane protein assembly factor BamA